jgi:hypothetical protein
MDRRSVMSTPPRTSLLHAPVERGVGDLRQCAEPSLLCQLLVQFQQVVQRERLSGAGVLGMRWQAGGVGDIAVRLEQRHPRGDQSEQVAPGNMGSHRPFAASADPGDVPGRLGVEVVVDVRHSEQSAGRDRVRGTAFGGSESG